MEETSIRHITELLESLNPAQAPQTRSQAKRKRSPSPARVTPTLKETPIASLHVDGMDEEQIWAQLELKNKALCETLRYALDATGEDLEGDDTPESLGLGEDEDGDLDMDNHEDSEEDSEESEEDDLDESESEEEVSDEDSEEDNLGEGITILRDPDEAPSSAGDTLFSHIDAALNKPKKLRGRGGRSSELDDGFFNLADFNAQSEKAEAGKVSRGSLADDSDEDEDIEEIDLYKAMDDTEKDGDEAGM
jgi:U3 small nucleolar RNA-associated protein MPP10